MLADLLHLIFLAVLVMLVVSVVHELTHLAVFWLLGYEIRGFRGSLKWIDILVKPALRTQDLNKMLLYPLATSLFTGGVLAFLIGEARLVLPVLFGCIAASYYDAKEWKGKVWK